MSRSRVVLVTGGNRGIGLATAKAFVDAGDKVAITYRKDAIYHHMFAAHPEHNLCAVLGREAKVWKMVKPVVPTLKAVAMPISGLCRFTTYVSIRKEFDGQGNCVAGC